MRWVLAISFVAVIVAVALIFLRPTTHQLQCGGSLPKWMLDAQSWPSEGSCGEVLPSDQAPPNADWSMYCMTTYPSPPRADGFCEGI